MDTKKPSGSSDWVDPDDAPALTRAFFEQGEWRQGDKVIRRGRPPTGQARQLVSLRLDKDVLDALRALGPGWQAQANAALRRLAFGDAPKTTSSRKATPPAKTASQAR